MQKTDIEYLTHTWNPFAMRCSKVSDGCKNCWHMRYADRLAHCHTISFEKKLAYAGMQDPILDAEEGAAPLKMKKAARIGVQFMGDIFHNKIKFMDVLSVVNVITACKNHQFFMLTKRVERMVEFFRDYAPPGPYLAPENLWAGISVEDQKSADDRLQHLSEFFTWHKWISVEPLLGPVDLSGIINMVYLDARRMIDWVIVGVETGPGRRQCKFEWVESIVMQCQAYHVPVFFKNAKQDMGWNKGMIMTQEWPKGLKDK
jgi:protein gp37